MPVLLASDKRVQSHCYNPFNPTAPNSFGVKSKKILPIALHCFLDSDSPVEPFLFLYIDNLRTDMNMDEEIGQGGFIGFCIHTDRDVLLCGLYPDAAKIAFMKVAEQRNATNIIINSSTMIPIIAAKATEDI